MRPAPGPPSCRATAVARAAPVAAGALLGGALLGAAPAALAAQGLTSAPIALDVGLARIQQVGTAPLLAPSVGASWRERRGRGAGGLAAVAAAGDGRLAAQLAADGARAFGPARAPTEVTAELRAARVPNTPWAAQLHAGVRQRVAWRGGGAWAGVDGGVVRQVGRDWPSAGGELGVWAPAGAGARVALTLSGASARVEERGLVAAGVNAFGPARVRTGDVVASYAAAFPRAPGRLEVGAWAGARAYWPNGLRALPADDEDQTLPGAPLRRRVLAVGSLTAWLAPTVGLTASAGVLPNDPVRGLPGARHLLFAVRVRPWRAPHAELPHAANVRPPVRPVALDGPRLLVDEAPVAEAPAAEAPVAEAPAAAAVDRAVRVLAPGAARVELRADATAWRPVPLARAGDGAWTARLPLAAGTHRVLVRVDDGPWRPPANLPAVDDDLGVQVGLLVVP